MKMACKKAYEMPEKENEKNENENSGENTQEDPVSSVPRLYFGVDSEVRSDDLLQNNLTEFEWVMRNKMAPNFWGRSIVGENRLTKDEVEFLHSKGCKVAALYRTDDAKKTEEQGRLEAEKLVSAAQELAIPKGAAIFFEIGEKETVTKDYMKSLISGVSRTGYVLGFKANTDAAFDFDREYSRGVQTDRERFLSCPIWAVAPNLKEYERVTTTHLIHPDRWAPFAPSGIARNEIAVWRYGKNCHPIGDDDGRETTFDVNLVRNDAVIIKMMF